MYRSNPYMCKDCLLFSQCAQNKDFTKRISRHILADYVEEVEHLRHTQEQTTVCVVEGND